METRRFGIENINMAIDFDKLCFPTDFRKEEDWKELLSDEKAAYYALCEGNKLFSST